MSREKCDRRTHEDEESYGQAERAKRVGAKPPGFRALGGSITVTSLSLAYACGASRVRFPLAANVVVTLI